MRIAAIVSWPLGLAVPCVVAGLGAEVEPVIPGARIEPGLALAVRPVRSGDGALDEDVFPVRTLALHVEHGAPATPFVAPGPFRATWRGSVDVPRRDDYVFAFEGAGSFTLEIDGEVVLDGSVGAGARAVGEPVRLRKGARALVASFRTPLSGAGSLRVTWRSRNLAEETIPPMLLSHDAAAADVEAGRLRRQGRMLLATRRCTACHVAPEADAMPELAMRGPRLVDAGARLEPAWLAAWIADPHALRPDARMPQVLQGNAAARARDAADLAAFVASQGAPEPAGERAPAAGDARAGARVWLELGCFACHDFGAEAAEAAEAGADGDRAWITLAHTAAKYRPGAIAAFVAAPRAHEPWIRMPDLKLTDVEARDLEAFVRERSRATVPAAPGGDPERGARRFVDLGCASCHDAGVDAVAPAGAWPFARLCADGAWDRGCVATDALARGAAPEFRWTAAERVALRSFALAGPASLRRDTAADFAARQLDERRCDVCHVIDGRTATWTLREPDPATVDPTPRAGPDPAVGEAVEVAQLRPALTWAGEKLRADWMEGFLRGDLASPRPWLRARMPELHPAVAAGFARGLAAQHGHGVTVDGGGVDGAEVDGAAIDGAKVAVGRALIRQEGGFGCVTCHAVGPQQPVALFEVQGVNFAAVAERLRPAFYRRWMMDPPRYEAATRMPKYAGDDGRTALAPYGGDAARQFDAIWHFLRFGEEVR